MHEHLVRVIWLDNSDNYQVRVLEHAAFDWKHGKHDQLEAASIAGGSGRTMEEANHQAQSQIDDVNILVLRPVHPDGSEFGEPGKIHETEPEG